ncbi:MAG: CRISPR-associated protein Cas4 [Chloroflexi bacterium]|nr:CRISPR-associated protein Cas4 [Chloroflexota bacterium]
MLAILAILVILIGFLILSQGRRMQIETGLPSGRVVYADTGAWKTVERPLFSALHQLAGKPDYVVKQGRQTIPIEVKSGSAPGDGPRRSHLLQLAAYCLLIEEHYQQRPEYGIIKYADRTFEIDYTPALETALLDVLDSMRANLDEGEAARSHDEPGRCLHCGYRHACDERLA